MAAERSAPQLWLAATVLLTIGALAVAVAMAPSASAPPGRGLGWLLFLGSSVHVAGTGWLYTLDDVRSHASRHQARYVWAPVGLVLATAAAAAAFSPTAFAWLLGPYFAWQFVHFQKQNLGMAALAASSRGLAGLQAAERRSLIVAGVAGIARFSLPVFAFRSPYAAVGGMTIAHGLQYLLLVGLVAAGGKPGKGRLLRLAFLGNVALIGGVVLNLASHLQDGDAATRSVFGAYLGVVMAHFVIDAGLWRLRDPFARQFLSSRVPYLFAARPRRQEVSLDDRSPADIRLCP